ncbi:ribosome maturation factor RimM [Hathewaya limosa]|uniref:Ribosome maturation factor RimM n=1 Tax=Hathewaya limosa TaxID=1536 RepID=A0ABU0JPL4_HATLI|nr:ribosome maturation factor RimM [Hathewaya limosa]AWZ48690.1 16S rRNA processing protein RimM [Clostridiaceae bacterium 14S0207]MDQ0479026.1 16S rRNA processing protein RimM [Hathewaya limosa]
MLKEFLVVGQISKPHGIKGEVKVFPLTDDIKRFKKLDYVIINDEEFKIESCKLQNDRVILKFDKINSIDEAIRYKNVQLKIRREDAVKLPEDHYYIADLLQCEVYDTEETYLGKMFDVIETGSNDVYWIKNEGKELLIPAIGSVVRKVDIQNSKITILPVKEWM